MSGFSSEDDLGGRRLRYRNDDDQESRYDRFDCFK